MLRLENSKSIKSILRLRMPWHLASSGHQQLRYWMCKVNESMSSKRSVFPMKCAVSILRNIHEYTSMSLPIFFQGGNDIRFQITKDNCDMIKHEDLGGHFKNVYELVNLGALKNLHFYTSFNVWIRYFVWNFKGHLWNSTQNILPIPWKIRF